MGRMVAPPLDAAMTVLQRINDQLTARATSGLRDAVTAIGSDIALQ